MKQYPFTRLVRLLGIGCLLVAGGCAERAAPITAEPAASASEAQSSEKPLTPDAKEWSSIDKVAVKRAPKTCDVRRRGDQMRVHCDKVFANGAAQIAGSPEGVRFSAHDEKQSVVFPMRKGDRRVIQYADFQANRWAWGASAVMTITAYWLEGEAAPTVVIE